MEEDESYEQDGAKVEGVSKVIRIVKGSEGQIDYRQRWYELSAW